MKMPFGMTSNLDGTFRRNFTKYGIDGGFYFELTRLLIFMKRLSYFWVFATLSLTNEISFKKIHQKFI